MLPEQRRRGRRPQARLDLNRRVHELDLAGGGVGHRGCRGHPGVCRGLQRIRHRSDLPGGHAHLLERREPLVRAPGGETPLDQRDEGVTVLNAPGVAGEALVGRQLGRAQHIA